MSELGLLPPINYSRPNRRKLPRNREASKEVVYFGQSIIRVCPTTRSHQKGREINHESN